MAQQFAPEKVVQTIAAALQTVAPNVGSVDASTPLTGENAVIDSVGLVSLLVALEESLQRQLHDSAHGDVSLPPLLLQQDSGDATQNPFRTVGALAEHISELVSSENA